MCLSRRQCRRLRLLRGCLPGNCAPKSRAATLPAGSRGSHVSGSVLLGAGLPAQDTGPQGRPELVLWAEKLFVLMRVSL